MVCVRNRGSNESRRRRPRNYKYNRTYGPRLRDPKHKTPIGAFGPDLPPKYYKRNPQRGKYFKVFRPERKMLNLVENSYLVKHNRKEYRANRYLYYFVIPHLSKNLWFPPDRERLQGVEVSVFNQLLSYRFKVRRFSEPNRVPIWSFRSSSMAIAQE